MKKGFSLKNSPERGIGIRVVLSLFFTGWGVLSTIPAVSAGTRAFQADRKVLSTSRPFQPAAGVFLVAESHLRDPNFSQSVVLILQHGPDGSIGLIVNRPTSTPLTKIWPELKGVRETEDPLFIGGPVRHETFGMLYLGDREKNNGVPVFENVYYSNNADHLAPIASGRAGGASAFRVYAGYAGWAPGQLQAELQRGDWRLVGGYPDAIFYADPGEIWAELLEASEREWIRLPPRDSPAIRSAGIASP